MSDGDQVGVAGGAAFSCDRAGDGQLSAAALAEHVVRDQRRRGAAQQLGAGTAQKLRRGKIAVKNFAVGVDAGQAAGKQLHQGGKTPLQKLVLLHEDGDAGGGVVLLFKVFPEPAGT